jgi:hypothetical protein
MFALHYFATSEAKLQQFARTVSANLVPGGLFFGIAVDGDAVAKMLGDTRGVQNKVFSLQRCLEKRYIFSIVNSVVDKGSKEPFLTNSSLVNALHGTGLEAVTNWSAHTRFSEVAKWVSHDGVNADRVLKPLLPGRWTYSGQDADALRLCSSLFSSFVIRKLP